MKVLMIGGNGNISWYCTQKAIEAGYEVWELNRGLTRRTRRAVQPEVRQLIGDMRCFDEAYKLIKDMTFDVVCDFICFNNEQAENDIRLFEGRTKQLIFISSESVYMRKSSSIPFTESAEQYNVSVPDSYIAGKIHAEQVFQMAYETRNFPVTIVRPGYTYDVIVPAPIGHNCFTAPGKYLLGYPLLMPGDGTNLWSPLHSRDFANGFIRLMGNPDAIGEAFHITNDTLTTWNELAEQLLAALGVQNQQIIHIPYDEALLINTFQSNIIVQQRMWHYVYNNSKIKKIADGWKAETSFAEGIKETVDWLFLDESHRRFNPKYDANLDKLYAKYWTYRGNRK
ncbi:MAG TPA: NAD-dependent epimerase/dehydratase family protein [Desulfitobacterium dehalogenans]|uniref:NAD-dependent epimerase/dehydratase family protein n=1 Tax=Desulfitobacterium dehalogenans TaxID=36854 RepID=A0A7C6Z4D7_9FIRM|nr:NAD-dependent epimerase/dehydratase family protein [Desulfitobacterium dehalogenans]